MPQRAIPLGIPALAGIPGKPGVNFIMNLSDDFKNHWLAGFSDADASFQIKIINRTTRNQPEIRLNYQIDQKSNILLTKIKII